MGGFSRLPRPARGCVISGAANRYGAADMIIGFVIFWVVLGLGVLLVALRGGPRGARQALHTESKAGQRALTAVVVVLFAFGLVVPGLVLASNSTHKASVAAGGLHLNAEQQKGRELFSHACNLCHTLQASNAVGRIGPNLDLLLPNVAASGRKQFVLSAILEGRARGAGQMPALLFQGKEAEDVANFVATVAGH
jgi:mono/diheme cytochrome c family protein